MTELELLGPRQLLAVIIGFSIVLFALASNLGFANSERRGEPRGWDNNPVLSTLVELARWVYYLGLPYVTLLVGYNTARALGIWNLDWLETLPYAGILLLGAILVFIWVWRPYTSAEQPELGEGRWSWARHVLETIYQQAHWAFYRSGPILWLGDYYWGSFIGLALTLVEGWSNPNVRLRVREISRADAPLWSGSLAIVSTIVFVFTQNTWYGLLVHLILDLGLRRVLGFPTVTSLPSPESFEYDASAEISEY